MDSKTEFFRPATFLLFAISMIGCKTFDRSSIASMDSLSDDAHVIIEKSVNENFSTVASAKTTTSVGRPVIRTLRAGEDLNAIVNNSSGVVLLDFYADWCGPCRKQSHELNAMREFTAEVDGQIVKINVDEHRELAKEYEVSSLPTLLAVRDGQVLQRKLGFTKRDEVKSMLR